jgi:hypothetical protein
MRTIPGDQEHFEVFKYVGTMAAVLSFVFLSKLPPQIKQRRSNLKSPTHTSPVHAHAQRAVEFYPILRKTTRHIPHA